MRESAIGIFLRNLPKNIWEMFRLSEVFQRVVTVTVIDSIGDNKMNHFAKSFSDVYFRRFHFLEHIIYLIYV